MASHVIDTSRTSGATPALASLSSLRQRFAAWRTARSERARIARELASYTDRELFDLGISRANIPEIIDGTFRR